MHIMSLHTLLSLTINRDEYQVTSQGLWLAQGNFYCSLLLDVQDLIGIQCHCVSMYNAANVNGVSYKCALILVHYGIACH